MARAYKLIVGVNKKIAYVSLLQAKPSTCASLHLLVLAASYSPCARWASGVHARARGLSRGQTEQGGERGRFPRTLLRGRFPRTTGRWPAIPSVPVARPPLSTSNTQNPQQHLLLVPQQQSGIMHLYFLNLGQSLISPDPALFAGVMLSPSFSLPWFLP